MRTAEGIVASGEAGLSDPTAIRARRIIGQFGGERPGPQILCVGGLHGNEPSGVLALRRVLGRLDAHRPAFAGRLLGTTGNLAALRARRRYIERDLNRDWTVKCVASVLERPRTAEDHEQAALLGVLVPAIREATDDVYVLDLHTTSSTSPPFATLGDTLEAREFARELDMPLVLGIEEEIDTMVDYLAGFGAVAMGIESGRHDDPASVDLHEAALWLSLVTAGCLPADTDVVDLAACRRRLSRARDGLPDVFEVVYRRAIGPDDEFRMESGFANFTPVRAGDVVARDVRGPVPVPTDGRLFLPLYQEQGDDGYFVVRPA